MNYDSEIRKTEGKDNFYWPLNWSTFEISFKVIETPEKTENTWKEKKIPCDTKQVLSLVHENYLTVLNEITHI